MAENPRISAPTTDGLLVITKSPGTLLIAPESKHGKKWGWTDMAGFSPAPCTGLATANDSGGRTGPIFSHISTWNNLLGLQKYSLIHWPKTHLHVYSVLALC